MVQYVNPGSDPSGNDQCGGDRSHLASSIPLLTIWLPAERGQHVIAQPGHHQAIKGTKQTREDQGGCNDINRALFLVCYRLFGKHAAAAQCVCLQMRKFKPEPFDTDDEIYETFADSDGVTQAWIDDIYGIMTRDCNADADADADAGICGSCGLCTYSRIYGCG